MKSFSLPLLVLLSACAMQNPSFIHNEKMQVLREPVSAGFDANALPKSQMLAMVDDIKHRAGQDVTVTVAYPPHGNAQLAAAQGAQVKQFLLAHDIKRDVRVETAPTATGPNNIVTLNYSALRAASSCDTPIQNADAGLYDHGSDANYRFGCAHDQMLAMQIARPEDLLGNDTTTLAESQRVAKSLDNYRAGENATPENTQPLTASTVYQQ